MILGIYLIIGLVYTAINGLIRKINTDGDPLLPLVWWFLWPMCFLGLLIALVYDKFNKKKL